MSPLSRCGGLVRHVSSPGALIALGIASTLALAPNAGAATTTAQGTVASGTLSNTAPSITDFSATLDGVTQDVPTTVGGWNVTDATGSGDGYSVTVAASDPTISGSTATNPTAGTGFAMKLTPATATAAVNNPATTGPVATSIQTLSTTPVTIENAAASTGQGEWDFPADTGGAQSMDVVVPGDASNGTYSSTLTFTTAPPVA